MRIAQQLYEGVNIERTGTVGLITYLRTDSTRISVEADAAAKEYIKEAYGAEFVGAGTVAKKDDKKVQDAHEAIRPTYMTNSPASIKDELSRDQFRLYQLIWNRFMASRMAPAKYENTSVKIAAGDYRFNASASKIAFDGFLSVYNINNEKSEGNVMLKSIDEDTKLTLNNLEPKQHFTQPPAHYTEASLVKTLEEFGIGRPVLTHNDLNDHSKTLCCQRKEELIRHRAWRSSQQHDEESIRKYRRCELHSDDGRSA